MEKQLLSKVLAESSSLWFSFRFFKQKQVQKAELNAPTLKKFIYRLKQTSRQWYLKFDEVIKKFGF
jgi:hypothetical protein